MERKQMKKNLICINCPMGCELNVDYTAKKIIKVEGNTCKRGITYAETEIFHPVRIVTTTVRVKDCSIPFVPVKTEKPVPKKIAFKIIQRASKITLHAPVKSGDVVIQNIMDSGVNLIATRSLARTRQKSKKILKKK